jgi:hypothetical protein
MLLRGNSPPNFRTFQARANTRDGKLLGVYEVSKTDCKRQTFNTKTKKHKGVHDLFFVFKSSKGELFNFDF